MAGNQGYQVVDLWDPLQDLLFCPIGTQLSLKCFRKGQFEN